MSENNKRHLLFLDFLKDCPIGSTVDISTDAGPYSGVFTDKNEDMLSIVLSTADGGKSKIFFEDVKIKTWNEEWILLQNCLERYFLDNVNLRFHLTLHFMS